jgi:hypothetical protein
MVNVEDLDDRSVLHVLSNLAPEQPDVKASNRLCPDFERVA